MPLAELLANQRILPGIKVDTGAKPLAGSPDETVTEGLDGLRERLAEYRNLGARFAKWRAVIRIADGLPSRACIGANAHALARYAALCQEQELVPIVEPEVLMNGSHSIERCEEVTGAVLHAVFNALAEQRVALGGHAAEAQHGHRRGGVPRSGLGGGGRDRDVAVLAAACSRRGARALSFSPAARTNDWRPCTWMRSTGCPSRSPGRSASRTGGRCRIRRWRLGTDATRTWPPAGRRFTGVRGYNSAASLGTYAIEMEDGPLEAGGPPHRREWRDD